MTSMCLTGSYATRSQKLHQGEVKHVPNTRVAVLVEVYSGDCIQLYNHAYGT